MRTYRLPDGGTLVEIGLPAAMHLTLDEAGRFTLFTEGEPIEPRLYRQLDASGAQVAGFGVPRTYALDDYFYIYELYFVRGDTLYRGGIELGAPSGTYRCTPMSATIELTGLVLVERAGPQSTSENV